MFKMSSEILVSLYIGFMIAILGLACLVVFIKSTIKYGYDQFDLSILFFSTLLISLGVVYMSVGLGIIIVV